MFPDAQVTLSFEYTTALVELSLALFDNASHYYNNDRISPSNTILRTHTLPPILFAVTTEASHPVEIIIAPNNAANRVLFQYRKHTSCTYKPLIEPLSLLPPLQGRSGACHRREAAS